MSILRWVFIAGYTPRKTESWGTLNQGFRFVQTAKLREVRSVSDADSKVLSGLFLADLVLRTVYLREASEPAMAPVGVGAVLAGLADREAGGRGVAAGSKAWLQIGLVCSSGVFLVGETSADVAAVFDADLVLGAVILGEATPKAPAHALMAAILIGVADHSVGGVGIVVAGSIALSELLGSFAVLGIARVGREGVEGFATG